MIDGVLGSIAVRPPLPPKDALAELHVRLDAEGLNPRLVGETLILSNWTPRDNLGKWAANDPVVRVEGLPFVTPGLDLAGRAALIEEMIKSHMETPGAKLLEGGALRGVDRSELEYMPGYFSSEINAFARTRQARMTAFYGHTSRSETLDLLHRAFRAMTMNDWPQPD